MCLATRSAVLLPTTEVDIFLLLPVVEAEILVAGGTPLSDIATTWCVEVLLAATTRERPWNI
jgi:hypothetical protein